MADLISLAHHNRDPDAVEIGALYQRARDSMADSVQHALEAGTRLTLKKASLPHGQWLPWLEANRDLLQFDTPRTAQRLIAAAAEYDVNVALSDTDTTRINRQIWGNTTLRGTTGTGDNEWFTPSVYIETAREVMGSIDLDPASHELAQETVGADRYFTRENDGLAQEWHGRVWLNPPYGREVIWQFVDKLAEEIDCGNTTAAIMLTHNYTDTEWFHEAVKRASALCFTLSRVRFLDTEGKEANPTQGQVFFYYGQNPVAFAHHFAPFGFVLIPAPFKTATAPTPAPARAAR